MLAEYGYVPSGASRGKHLDDRAHVSSSMHALVITVIAIFKPILLMHQLRCPYLSFGNVPPRHLFHLAGMDHH